MGIPVWPLSSTDRTRDNMSRNALKTLISTLVLAVTLCSVIFSYPNCDVQRVAGYTITATFSSVGSLTEGADVKLSGIKVGRGLGLNIDPTTFLAEVRMATGDRI